MKKWQKSGVFAAVMSLALAACGTEPSDTGAENAAEQIDATLAEAIGDNGSLSVASGAFERTGLAGVLEGEASYTVLAPSDAAFDALGEDAANALNSAENGAILAAILREHMIPGTLTPDDIRKAISDKDEVSMGSLGEGDLSFRLDGNAIVVTNGTGQSAQLGDNAVTASNGVIIPIDAVLADPEALRPGA